MARARRAPTARQAGVSGSRSFGFRVEASAGIGMGHFMRCYALAETCKRRGHAVTFLSVSPDASVLRRLASAEFRAMPLSADTPHEADVTETVGWVRGH